MTLLIAPLPQIHLNPGELLMTHEPCRVCTVLGSCVAVTIFSMRLRFAAICHGMMPGPRRGGCAMGHQHPDRFKYLSEAIPAMVAQARLLGLMPQEIEVKLFGGGNVLDLDGPSPRPEKRLGTVNVETSLALLEAASLSIKASNVGGTCGRKILFDTQTGEVLHKHLHLGCSKNP